jgi:hypothetical protein
MLRFVFRGRKVAQGRVQAGGVRGHRPTGTVGVALSCGVLDAGLGGVVQPGAAALDHRLSSACRLRGAVRNAPRRYRAGVGTHITGSPPNPGRFTPAPKLHGVKVGGHRAPTRG